MNILITGGSGYIAGRLASHLINSDNDFKVVLASRQNNPNLPFSEIKNFKIDWDSTENINYACSNIDIVIHAAGLNAQECKDSFLTAYKVNTINTAKILNAAIIKGVKRFIYISTLHVYGSNLNGNINENSFSNSIETYAASHKAAEDIVLNANLKESIEGVVIRLSNSYGAPASKIVNCWHLLINDLCYKGVTENKLTINSTGEQLRDFIPMQNVVRAIEHILCLSPKLLGNSIFNVASADSTSVIEIAEKVSKVFSDHFNYKPEIEVKEKTPANLEKGKNQFVIDISKLLSTGYNNEDTFEDEIINLINYVELNFGIEK